MGAVTPNADRYRLSGSIRWAGCGTLPRCEQALPRAVAGWTGLHAVEWMAMDGMDNRPGMEWRRQANGPMARDSATPMGRAWNDHEWTTDPGAVRSGASTRPAPTGWNRRCRDVRHGLIGAGASDMRSAMRSAPNSFRSIDQRLLPSSRNAKSLPVTRESTRARRRRPARNRRSSSTRRSPPTPGTVRRRCRVAVVCRTSGSGPSTIGPDSQVRIDVVGVRPPRRGGTSPSDLGATSLLVSALTIADAAQHQ